MNDNKKYQTLLSITYIKQDSIKLRIAKEESACCACWYVWSVYCLI